MSKTKLNYNDRVYVPRQAFGASGAIAATTSYAAVTGLTAAITLTLPAVSAYPVSLPLVIADESGSCSSTLTITINDSAGNPVLVLNKPKAAIVLYGTGSAWLVGVPLNPIGDAGAMTVTETGGTPRAVPDAFAAKFEKTGGTVTGNFAVNLSGVTVSAPAGTVAQFVGNSSVAAVAVDAYGGSGTPNPTFIFRGARGTAAAPTATQSGDILGNFSARGYGATGFASVASATIQANATQNFTDSAQGTAIVVRVTPNGTVSKIEAARFDHNGYLGIGTTAPQYPLHVIGSIFGDVSPATAIETGQSTARALADHLKLKANVADVSPIINDISGLFAKLSTGAGLDLRASESTLASAATVDLGSVATLKVAISGSAAITSFGSTTYGLRVLLFTGACTLTPGSSLILPTGAAITTAAGDRALAVSDASAVWTVIVYQRADGTPLSLGGAHRFDIAQTLTAAQRALALANIGLNGLGPAAVNGIDNAEMRVAQRGTSFANVASGASTGQLTLDRWYAFRGGFVAGMSVSQVAGPTGYAKALKLQRAQNDTSTQYLAIGQVIESIDFARFAGQSVTISFAVQAGANFSAANAAVGISLITGTGTDEGRTAAINQSFAGNVSAGSSVTATTTARRVSVTFNVPNTATEGAVHVSYVPTGTAGADDSLSVTAVQIEEGTVAGPFQRTPLAFDETRCRRHYQQYGGVANYYVGSGVTNGNYGYFGLRLQTRMRAAPNFNIAFANFYISDGVSGYTPTGVTFANPPSVDDVNFGLNASGMTAGRGVLLTTTSNTSNAPSALITLTADL